MRPVQQYEEVAKNTGCLLGVVAVVGTLWLLGIVGAYRIWLHFVVAQ